MIRALLLPAALIAALTAVPLTAAEKPAAASSPGEIVAAAPADEWRRIAADDLLIMDLAVDPRGKPRRVVIQLMPAPFSQGWVGNMRKLAAAHWWDGLSVYRVQDNYVTQWGDADGEDKAKARALPAGLVRVLEREYQRVILEDVTPGFIEALKLNHQSGDVPVIADRDAYARRGISFLSNGWPLAMDVKNYWPIHCYGMVGVARDLSPDTGTGAELYTVIGHAPRHLDRNIALVGRVIEGMQWLSSLPRGTGASGFYETPEERTQIISVRLSSELPATEQPKFEYLSTESQTFARYAEAIANRRDPFFIQPAGGADICNVRVPVRRVKDSVSKKQ